MGHSVYQQTDLLTIKNGAACLIFWSVFSVRISWRVGRQRPRLSNFSSRCCWSEWLLLIHCSERSATTVCATHPCTVTVITTTLNNTVVQFTPQTHSGLFVPSWIVCSMDHSHHRWTIVPCCEGCSFFLGI